MRLARKLSRSLLLLVPASVVGALLAPVASAQAVSYPSVVIDSPATNATVTGLTSVKVTAQTDPKGTDLVGPMTLYIDGQVGGGDNSCFPQVASCTAYFLYDWSGMTGSHTEQVKMTTKNGVTVSSPVITVNAVSPAPTVSILAPAGGATVSGASVSVQTTGTVDPSQDEDFPGTMALLVDGTSVASDNCGVSSTSSCPKTLSWITTGWALGAHTLQAKFTTSHGNSALSAGVKVTLAADPTAPVVTLTAPTAGSTVAGQVQVLASGTVATGETPYYMILVIDHQVFGSAELCPAPAGTSTCSLSLIFDTTGMSGQHTVQVAFFDTDGHEGLTTPITVTVSNPPPGTALVTLTPGATYQRGATGAVTGTVANFQTHIPLSGVPVTVVFTPVNGPAQTVTATSSSSGGFTAADPAPLTSNTAVVASTGPAYGSASASTVLSVTVPISCNVPASVHRGVTLTVTCTVTGLADGSVVALRFAAPVPHATDFEKVRGGLVSFVTSFSHAQRLQVWATTETTRTYVASRSATYLLNVS
jgi:hypothetical protein